MSSNRYTKSKNISRALKKEMAATSKAFRAKLHLSEHDASKLQLWAKRNCAISNIFIGPRNATILIALKDRPRSAASFARSVRAALNNMAITSCCVRGHWVTLITEEECLKLCDAKTTDMPVANHGVHHHHRSRSKDSSDAKTVLLPVR